MVIEQRHQRFTLMGDRFHGLSPDELISTTTEPLKRQNGFTTTNYLQFCFLNPKLLGVQRNRKCDSYLEN